MRTRGHLIVVAVFSAVSSGLASPPPQNLSTWKDLDAEVAARYAKLANPVHHVYPPGPFLYRISDGYNVFDPQGEIAAITNAVSPSRHLGVPVWTFWVAEAGRAERLWLYTGTGAEPFHTNAVPLAFDPRAWTCREYGDPPAWLDADGLEKWHGDRDRSRLRLGFSLVASNDWPVLEEALHMAATNAAASGAFVPALPPDTNSIAFAGVETGNGNVLRLWVYTPTNPVPLDVFSCGALTGGVWSLAGRIEAGYAFGSWDCPGMSGTAFFLAARNDVDSDGDSIPDGQEVFSLWTDPDSWDSDGDGLSDWEELFRYETCPHLRDSDDDHIWDEWEVGYKLNPNDISDGAADADGDGLANREEFDLCTDPRAKDTEGDGVPDDEDETPGSPGPPVAIVEPQEGAVLTNSSVMVWGVVAASGGLDDVWVRGTRSEVFDNGDGTSSFTNGLSLGEGDRRISATVMSGGSAVPASRASVRVTVDALPPVITVLSPSNLQSFAEAGVHVTVWTDSSNDVVTVNGAATSRDGFIRYAWVRLAVIGTNTVHIAAVDRFGREGTNAVAVVCTDTTYADPADDDKDGIPNADDPDPDNPSVRGSVFITDPPNGAIFYAE